MVPYMRLEIDPNPAFNQDAGEYESEVVSTIVDLQNWERH
jgi:hypothetical protein